MNINIYHQLFNFFAFIITGIIIGILFDIFRIIRKSFKTPDFVTYIEDIIFWILAGFILLFTIFTFNNGEIRVYIFFSLILGLLVYMLTLSKYFIKVNVSILQFIQKIIKLPLQIIVNFAKKFFICPIMNITKKVRGNVTKWIKKRRILWKNVEKNI